MANRTHDALSRRDLLKLGAVAAPLLSITDLAAPRAAGAQAPKRGGVFRLAGFDPPHFDPHQTPHWWTFIYLSLTHSSLLRHKAGPQVVPGTLPVEGDLAESWERPTETTYVFKLRRGVRWHNKPPVNGRELTADDVVYTFQRALTVKGNPNRAALEEIDKVEAVDRYTVRFTMKEPFAWFLDSAALLYILPREAADKDGMYKKPETVIGTGAWMLERYEPNVRLSFVRNPSFYRSGLPYVDGVDVRIDTDPASKLAAWLSGQYDFAPEIQMTLQRTDLEVIRRRKPNLPTAEFTWLISTFGVPKLEAEPFGDVRVRRALHTAVNLKAVMEVNPMAAGQGAPNPIVPAALRDWAIPIAELTPEGRRLYEHDPAEARRLLTQAGLGGGLRFPVESTGSWGPAFSDVVQAILSEWKRAGIETDLKLKEGNAFIASTLGRAFEKAVITLRGGATTPDPYLVNLLPGAPQNVAGVNDPKLTEMIRLQRRTFDERKRRDILWDIQRHFAQQAYLLLVSPSARVVSAWEPYVKNFAPNISLDYGGRLMIAWLDK
ncbi:MAG: ABC transporter substrate-binding protein [Candidatus Rokuibacteriota bacterium]